MSHTLTYSHTGIPVLEKLDGMAYIAPLKVWITDHAKHPWHIEFLYFEPDSPVAAAAQEETHVAYLTDDLDAAIAGKPILIAPLQAAPHMRIAYIYDAGLPVELIQLS